MEEILKLLSLAQAKSQISGDLLNTRSLVAGEHLFRSGDKSDLVGLVTRGLIYTYYVDEKGDQKVKKFSMPGDIVSPFGTILDGTLRCLFSAVAFEQSEILYVSYSNLQKLKQTSPIVQDLEFNMLKYSYIEKERREYDSLCLSNKQRYQRFLERYPDLSNKIPQYLIASYLGITSVSLSRIRAKI